MDETRAKVVDLDLNDILPNRFQPRIKFNEDAIIELSESIKEHGVIQPIIVRPIGDKYEIIAGERRYKASILAGRDTIPAIISSFNDKDSAEVALIENVQRRDLTPIEEAVSYKKILDMNYLTQEQLAVKLGKSQSAIANKIRLLNLCDEVQEALLEEKISERHARSLLKLKETEKQKSMLKRIIEERLTVRKTEEEIEKMNTFITNPIDDVTTNNDNPTMNSQNPSGQTESKPLDMQSLLMSETQKQAAAVDAAMAQPVVQPQPSVMSEPVSVSQPSVNPTPVETTQSPLPAVDLVSSGMPSTPIVETPTIASPSMIAPDSPSTTPMPMFTVPQIDPQNSQPSTVAEEKPFNMADLLATPAQRSTTETSSTPFVAPTSVGSTQTISTPAAPAPQSSSFGAQTIPATPILEQTLPTSFMPDPVRAEDNNSEGDTVVAISSTPSTPNESRSEEKVDIQPIIITDYNKQYDPVLPASAQPVEKVDFKQIINLIRELNNTIEKCGYTIETEEYDLEKEYQVVFKINKE